MSNVSLDKIKLDERHWPQSAELNLEIHDCPHPRSTIEWWYVNGHLNSAEGKAYSFFASFFRLAIGQDPLTQAYRFAYSLTWGLVDVEGQRYFPHSLVDPSAPEVGLETIKKGSSKKDRLFQQALKEIFEENCVPLPDRMLQQEVGIAEECLDLDFDGNRLLKREGGYDLFLRSPDGSQELTLRVDPRISPVRHGRDGEVVGTSGEDMFYYFIPMNQVQGQMKLDGRTVAVSGSAWYDHEFAKPKEIVEEKLDVDLLHDIAWNWISVQFAEGGQLTAYDLFDQERNSISAGRWCVSIDASGAPRYPDDFLFEPLEYWTSTRTFQSYPVKWRFRVPALDLEAEVKACFPEQEFVTLLSEPAFWEGRIELKGTRAGEAVEGHGFIEISGFGNIHRIEDFLGSVTQATRGAMERLLPLEPSEADLQRMVASPERAHFLKGLDGELYVERVLKPIREIIERGGKCWRSYAALACIDMVGGNSQDFEDWLIWPEMLHTGSLIIDDIQDQSAVRRGGPSCHAAHGEAVAINAGNAAYFLGQTLLLDDTLTPELKLRVYELYFETMRAAHAGQAMDICGFEHLMPGVIESGNSDQLEERILSVHRLKSAVPAAMLARLGAIKGGGSEAQIDRLGDYFEALGLAFQIMDDVLNLRGFEKNLKDKGEDITAGKLTMPVVKALGRLERGRREWLWTELQAGHQDPYAIGDVIQCLDACAAIDDCVIQAEALVEDAWSALREHIPASQTSLRLRAFSWFVLRRHY